MVRNTHTRRSRQAGFTLIELLVVIAIIAILIGLLLPAVQKVREAAARMSCSNNLKQLGIALHSYHDANDALPPGCARDQAPFGTAGTAGSGWGSSWKVYILPYIEQENIVRNWVYENNSGYLNPTNMPLVDRLTIKPYRCPSTPMADFYTTSGNAGSFQMFTSYTGIAGSNLPGAPIQNHATHGPGSGEGILFANSRIKLVGITDGTSNTLMVGEQSNNLLGVDGQPITAAYGSITSQGPHGWTMGAGQVNVGVAYTDRHFNCTTITLQINARGLTNTGPTGQNLGRNIPLSSGHTGGAMGLLGDGSVRFMRDTTSLLTLQLIANRQDGQPIPDEF